MDVNTETVTSFTMVTSYNTSTAMMEDVINQTHNAFLLFSTISSAEPINSTAYVTESINSTAYVTESINSTISVTASVNTTVSTLAYDATTPDPDDGKFTSDETEELCKYVIDLWICSFLSYFGIVTNVINIVVFAKMGFKDTMNISLTIIAAWDLLRCVCFALIRVYGPLDLVSPAKAESWSNVMEIYVGYAYTIAGYVSGVLAGYVAVERCLCISMPLTVRYLLTKKIVILTSLGLSLVVTGSYVCVYALFTFYWSHSPKFNESILVYTYSDYANDHPSLNVYINTVSIFWPTFAFIIICVCTAIISYYLRMASLFRSGSSTRTDRRNAGQLTARDRQVIKMLLVIIAVYIVCFFPRIVFYIPHQLVPGFHHRGKYHNTMWVYVYVMSVFDLINSSINMVVYYLMSSQFKNAFINTVCCRGRKR